MVNNGPWQWSTKKSMVLQVVRNGPNTYTNIDTNPPINRPVGLPRSISTVGSIPPTGEHGRYRWSVRLHLRRITVDRRSSIIDRDNFVIDSTDDTCAIYYVPSSRTVSKRTPLDESRCFEGGPLTHGSWWGKTVNWKPPGGWGFFRSTCRGCSSMNWTNSFENLMRKKLLFSKEACWNLTKSVRKVPCCVYFDFCASFFHQKSTCVAVFY